MYIFKNAFRCIARAKGRNILIGLIVLLLSVSSCIGLSINQANQMLKKQYADDMEITANLNTKNRRSQTEDLSIDRLSELANNESVKDVYYTTSLYFAAGDGIEPLDVAGSFKENQDFREKYGDIKNGESFSAEDGDMPELPEGFGGGSGFGGGTYNFFFNMASMNDFTVMGYSDLSALPEYVSSLNVIDADSEEYTCVISQNLAEENELAVGDTFTLKNPDNEDETYTFTIGGLCDTSQSTESEDTSSNASFTDNYIYISGKALDKIAAASAETNAVSKSEEAEETSEESEEEEEEKDPTLTATYSGTFIFANLENYNAFSEEVSENYTLVSEDVSRYEQSISQLETLGKYATYFLIVIFIIGAFVLVIINLFSIRNRKYEIGVLTAIGMKKFKVAIQFVIELFVVTFIALIIGGAIGSVTSVPVTNSLLTTINSQDVSAENMPDMSNLPNMPGGSGDSTNMPGFGGDFKQAFQNFGGNMKQYVTQISSATDLTVILEMILVGLGLTLVSSAAAIAVVMRYEPLKILNNRD